jgi:hypothetical protein
MALPAITQAGTAKLRPTMPPRRRPKRGDNEHDERMDVEGLDPESGLQRSLQQEVRAPLSAAQRRTGRGTRAPRALKLDRAARGAWAARAGSRSGQAGQALPDTIGPEIC